MSTPTATPLPVRFSTSSVMATMRSQLPICETSWPMKKRRKLRSCERAERLPHGGRASIRVAVSRSRTSTAAASRLDVVGRARCTCSVSQSASGCGRCRATPARRRERHPRDAPVVAVGRRGDEAGVLELADDLGDRRRGDLLDGGELAEGQRSRRGRWCRGSPASSASARPRPAGAGGGPGGWRRARAGPRDVSGTVGSSNSGEASGGWHISGVPGTRTEPDSDTL